jgi:hypothetical protein
MLTKRQAGKAGLTDKEEDAVVSFPKTLTVAAALDRKPGITFEVGCVSSCKDWRG